MRHLEKRNLSDCKLHYLDSILGYKLYVPDSYYNYLYFLKNGCPIWIDLGTNGECEVYECSTANQDETYNQLVDIIKSLPKRKGYYCTTMTERTVRRKAKQEGVILGVECRDENDSRQAYIIICNNTVMTQKEGIPCGEIVCIESKNEDALKVLSNFIFREYYINMYRSLLIYYNVKNEIDERYAKCLGLFKNRENLYYRQFE